MSSSVFNYSCCLPTLLLTVTLAVAVELNPADEARLTHMVLHDCGSCHGMTLRGGLGPALRAADLAERSDEALFAIITHGVAGTPMPPWQGILDAQEISWMVRQLKSGSLELH